MPPHRTIVDQPSTLEPVLDEPSTSRQIESMEPQDHESIAEVPTLAEAIALMTAELKTQDNKKSSIKLKTPDTFDGSDPKKLNNFILLCTLYFHSSSMYDDDSDKVTFALSYLRGTALEYFEPSILTLDNIPDWLDDWSIFIHTLRTQFGPVDPTTDAKDALDSLRMHENQHILKYNVYFNRFAVQTG